VALGTVHRALHALQAEGLTEHRKGAGVYVRATTPVARHSPQRLSRQQWGRGRPIWDADLPDTNYQVDQIHISEEPAPADIAVPLGVEPGEPTLVRRRRYSVEGRPVQLATSYLPAALVAGTPITWPDTGPGGIYARLAEIGHAPVRFIEEVCARMPLPEETKALDLPAATPVIRVVRTAVSEEGRTVEVNDMTLDAFAYVLTYEIDA